MKEKEAEVKEISKKEIEESLLLELEVADNDMDLIAKYFEMMFGHVDHDEPPTNYYMLGFRAGFRTARHIESDYQSMALINSSRKVHGEST